MRKPILVLLVLALALSACKGVGMGQISGKGWDATSEEDKADDDFWDKLYGRKALSRESGDWKNYYKAPNQDETKPDYCGFWGNCAGEAAAQPGNCNFYGNCGADQKKSGWW